MEIVQQESNIVNMMIIGILIMLAFALAFIIFANYSQKKILKEQMDKQKLAYDHQENLLYSTILTQEAERKRIAKDLHDEIGSKLNIILLNTFRLKEEVKEIESVADITTEIATIINRTIDSTRRISHELLPPTLEEFGLIEAIRELQHNYNQTETVEIDFKLAADENGVRDQLVELNFYRVLQELVNNSIRHGAASEIEIQLWNEKSKCSIHYKDNGKGFEMDDLKHKKGLGMKNIESRLHMIGATFEYESSINNGFEMKMELDI
ncbi:MAG: sensor histidine kinase [Crocinitomix sp.]|nr:sensor histidine kinase [Crocinitomix sp.]